MIYALAKCRAKPLEALAKYIVCRRHFFSIDQAFQCCDGPSQKFGLSLFEFHGDYGLVQNEEPKP